MDWHSAQNHCEKEGAYLAIADDGQKIHKLMRKLDYDAWIGLSKVGGQWKWVDGEYHYCFQLRHRPILQNYVEGT